MPTLADYGRLLESLDHALAQSHEHQAQTVRVHEQYLSYQADYAKLFTQLLQQQGDIFARGQSSPQQAELAAKVLDTLSNSMARFHDLQSETLSVHKRFLDQQAEYAQAHVDILRHQSALGPQPAALPLTQPKPAGGNGSQPHEKSYGERHEIHHSHAPRNGRAGGNGNGHNHLAPSVVEPAPVIHVLPAAHPSAPEKPAPAAPQPVVKAPAPAAPKPALQPPTSEPVRAAPVAAPTPALATPVVTPTTQALDAAALTSSLLAIVSEKTGYPTDMLELSMDMEADLGIDSIKRVEIMGALQERHPGLPKVEPQALAELRTLDQIVGYIGVEPAAKKA